MPITANAAPGNYLNATVKLSANTTITAVGNFDSDATIFTADDTGTIINDDGATTPTPTPPQVKVSLPVDTMDTSVPLATVIIEPVVTTFIDPGLDYVGFQGD